VTVAVPANIDVDEIGRTFASVVSDRPSVAGLWVSTSTDGYHLWLLIREADAVEERNLYRLVGILDEQSFGDYFQLHILTQSMYSIPVRDVLPGDAKKIFDHAA